MKKLVLFVLLILTVAFPSYSGLLSSLKANAASPISNPLLQQQQLQLPAIPSPLRSSSLPPNTASPNTASPNTASPNTASVPLSQKTTTITSAVAGNNSPVQNGGTTTSDSITFSFAFGGVATGSPTTTSGIAGFQCTLDNSPSASSCTSPSTFHNLAVGNHIFQVRAIDTAGNREANGASFSWTLLASSPSSSPSAQRAGTAPTTTPLPPSSSGTVPTSSGGGTSATANINITAAKATTTTIALRLSAPRLGD